MRKITGVAIGLAFLASTAVTAQAGLYVGLNAGAHVPTDSDVTFSTDLVTEAVNTSGEGDVSWDTGWWVGGAVGYACDSFPARIEAEVFAQNHDADESTAFGVTGDALAILDSYGALINLYYDFKNSTKLTPFIGVGIGAATFEISDVTSDFRDIEDVVIAWQVGGGVGYAVTENVSLDLKYRYYRTGDISDTVVDKLGVGDRVSQEIENSAHTILVGIRFNL